MKAKIKQILIILVLMLNYCGGGVTEQAFLVKYDPASRPAIFVLPEEVPNQYKKVALFCSLADIKLNFVEKLVYSQSAAAGWSLKLLAENNSVDEVICKRDWQKAFGASYPATDRTGKQKFPIKAFAVPLDIETEIVAVIELDNLVMSTQQPWLELISPPFPRDAQFIRNDISIRKTPAGTCPYFVSPKVNKFLIGNQVTNLAGRVAGQGAENLGGDALKSLNAKNRQICENSDVWRPTAPGECPEGTQKVEGVGCAVTETTMDRLEGKPSKGSDPLCQLFKETFTSARECGLTCIKDHGRGRGSKPCLKNCDKCFN